MAVYKVPREQASGWLIIGAVDFTSHVRQIEFDEDQPSIDIGTVADPGATAAGRLTRECTIEFTNSFSDGTTDGVYDLLQSLADGDEKAVTFQPYGSGASFPKWEWNTDIGYAPMGSFTPDEAVIPDLDLPIRNWTYTKAV